jgi:hypothetical protein
MLVSLTILGRKAIQNILAILDSGLDESKRRTWVQNNHIKILHDSETDDVTEPDDPSVDGVKTSIAMTPKSHSNRVSVLPFSKVWGYAKLHGLAVWVGRKTRERY